MTWIVGHLLAILIGVSLGLMGGGGSVLALPVLVYVMGVPVKSAIAMTLVVVGTVSVLGIIPHWRRVRVKTALIFGSATMVGSFLGASLASLPVVTGTLQMGLFVTAMLVAAVLMIRRGNRAEVVEYPLKPACQYCWLWLLTEGIGVGILTGLVGVGGGFAIVPALVLLGGLPMREAIATSLLILIANAIAGFAGYVGKVPLDLHLMLSFIMAAAIGTVIGSQLSPHVPAKKLQSWFGYFLLAVAALVLGQMQTQPSRSETPAIQRDAR